MPRLKTGYIRELKIKKGNKTTIKLKACWDYFDEKTGKYRTKAKIVLNRTEAKQFYDEMRRKEEAGGATVLEFEGRNFGHFADIFDKVHLVPAEIINGVKTSGYKSLKGKESQLTALKEFFGHRKLNNITPTLIKAFKQNRLNTPVTRDGKARKIASVNRELELLRFMLNTAKADGLIISVPSFKGIISASAEEKRNRILSHEEEKKLLDACDLADKQGRFMRTHLKPMIVCAVETAMRRGEILKLTWRDVDFSTQSILVRAENTKTETARVVPMSPRLKNVLERLYNEQNPLLADKVFRRKILGRHAGKQVCDPYFVDIADNFQSAFESACEDAKIFDFRFHDLRHTATTRMIQAGIRESVVMKITGHTQIKTFLRYLNPTTDSLVSEISKLAAYNSAVSATTHNEYVN